MLRELLTILRAQNTIGPIGDNFARMLELAREMTLAAGESYFDSADELRPKLSLYAQDKLVNEFERSIRKQLVAHLAVPGNNQDVSYCLMLMTLTKDVERLGDYAKQLPELKSLSQQPLPDDTIVQELRAIRRGIEQAFQSVSQILADSDHQRAINFMQQGQKLARRCEKLHRQIAQSDYDAATATLLTLGTRYYKRIGGHLLNVLSSEVVPLHELDFYDQNDID